MMRKLTYLLTLSAFALLVSCSKDDAPAPSAPEGNTVSLAFTAQVDYSIAETGGETAQADRAATRATADEDGTPTRFYGQAVAQTGAKTGVVAGTAGTTGDSYTFEFEELNPELTYDFLFWADNAAGDAPADLTAVPYEMGTIAFAARATGTPAGVDTDITLKHAVTEITLMNTAEVTLDESLDVTLSTDCATAYNIQTGSAANSERQTATFTATGDRLPAGKVLTTYVISPAKAQAVAVGVNLLEKIIDDVPLAADTRITLQGKLSIDDTWQGTPEYYKQVFTDIFFNKDGTPVGSESMGEYLCWASDETNRRIISDILKTTAYPGEYKTVTAPWGEDVYIGYVPSSLEIQYKGKKFIIYTQLEQQSNYPNLVLPDKIY